MNLGRLLALLLVWTVAILFVKAMVTSLGFVFDGQTVVFVLFFPWLVALVGYHPRDLGTALADAFRPGSGDLPATRRQRSANVLRVLGGLTFAVGLVAFFGIYLNVLRGVAMARDNAGSGDLAHGLGVMLLAPIYGLALRAFLYEPLATALEGDASELGAALGDRDEV